MPSIKYNDHLITYTDTTKTILEILEQSEIKVNFQCRGGICGTCRSKLIKGKVNYQNSPLAMIKSDEILLCIAQVNDGIEIKAI